MASSVNKVYSSPIWAPTLKFRTFQDEWQGRHSQRRDHGYMEIIVIAGKRQERNAMAPPHCRFYADPLVKTVKLAEKPI